MAPLKTKGDLAELKVAADLADRGCRISIPFSEDCDYDLIADYGGRLHRVQVKYTQSDGQVVVIRCRSHSLTNGRVRATKQSRSFSGASRNRTGDLSRARRTLCQLSYGPVEGIVRADALWEQTFVQGRNSSRGRGFVTI